MATDLGVHYLTTLHYLLGQTAPQSAICYGGSYRWKKIYPETEIPDVVNVLYQYPTFIFNLSITLNSQTQESGTLFMGTKGTILLNGAEMTFYPEANLDMYGWIVSAWPEAKQREFLKTNDFVGLDQAWAPGSSTARESHEQYGIVGDPDDLHSKNFVDSIRSRKPSIEGAVAAHNAVVGGHLANLSYKHGSCKVTWDGKQARVV
jgi:predicted dehydrogenase